MHCHKLSSDKKAWCYLFLKAVHPLVHEVDKENYFRFSYLTKINNVLTNKVAYCCFSRLDDANVHWDELLFAIHRCKFYISWYKLLMLSPDLEELCIYCVPLLPWKHHVDFKTTCWLSGISTNELNVFLWMKIHVTFVVCEWISNLSLLMNLEFSCRDYNVAKFVTWDK